MATSQRVFRIPPEISLDKINSYTCPPKMPAAILHDCRSAVTPSSKSERERSLSPTMRAAKAQGLLYSDGEDEEHPVVIEDDGSDSDSEAEGSEADREGPELGDGDDSSDNELPTLEELLRRPSPKTNTEFAAPDGMDDPAKRMSATAVLQSRQALGTCVAADQESLRVNKEESLDNSPANGESNRKANTVGDLLPTPNKRKLD